jgi:uncharacterized protein DUF4920
MPSLRLFGESADRLTRPPSAPTLMKASALAGANQIVNKKTAKTKTPAVLGAPLDPYLEPDKANPALCMRRTLDRDVMRGKRAMQMSDCGRMPIARKIAFALMSLFTLCIAGCESKAPPPSSSAAVAPKAGAPSSVKLGAPFRGSERVSLSQIAKDVARYANATVTTEGRVTAVCQAMGCWMEIADTNGEAHIRMTGHSFFVPKNASGRRAVVEGTVLPKPDDGECEQEALEATGKRVKLELDATGIELL